MHSYLPILGVGRLSWPSGQFNPQSGHLSTVYTSIVQGCRESPPAKDRRPNHYIHAANISCIVSSSIKSETFRGWCSTISIFGWYANFSCRFFVVSVPLAIFAAVSPIRLTKITLPFFRRPFCAPLLYGLPSFHRQHSRYDLYITSGPAAGVTR